jgi:hypothetical protein
LEHALASLAILPHLIAWLRLHLLHIAAALLVTYLAMFFAAVVTYHP